MKIEDIERNSSVFHDVADKVIKATERAFIEAGCPIPWWFEDTNKSVIHDAIDEIIQRGIEIEQR